MVISPLVDFQSSLCCERRLGEQKGRLNEPAFLFSAVGPRATQIWGFPPTVRQINRSRTCCFDNLCAPCYCAIAHEINDQANDSPLELSVRR